MFDWQREAFEKFLIWQAIKEKKKIIAPTHLMFNMATGTGKTLLMAAMILYYYKEYGRRHFLFFVNRNNIVSKTENNFIDRNHTKHLFTETISIDDVPVSIKKVTIFSDTPQGIEILFTSTHGLYNSIHIEKENKTTLDDLHSKDIVMLADEAHHLNAKTKKREATLFYDEMKNNASQEEIERLGWEHTVIDVILHKNGKKENNKNVLLEFTATIPEEKTVIEKYREKTIFSFDLKKFLNQGYTKTIHLISSNFSQEQRILQALLFQWYRHTVALNNNIANFKPVILFRSKQIDSLKEDYEQFLNLIDNLSIDNFNFIKDIEKEIVESHQKKLFDLGASRIHTVIKYIKEKNMHWGEIVHWIQESYQERNCIMTHSKEKSAIGKGNEKTTQAQDVLINSLEDANNHIRALFTVERLTEGWDVLNLFDIVRLYEGRDEARDRSGNVKAGKSTISERQLIGRGVRYYPFFYNNKVENKRKFDDDLEHELCILEELYFHSTSDHRYIDELKRELKKEGFISNEREYRTFAIKDTIKNKDFYKETVLWCNKQEDNPNRARQELEDIKKDFSFTY